MTNRYRHVLPVLLPLLLAACEIGTPANEWASQGASACLGGDLEACAEDCAAGFTRACEELPAPSTDCASATKADCRAGDQGACQCLCDAGDLRACNRVGVDPGTGDGNTGDPKTANLQYENEFETGMGAYGEDYTINHYGSFTDQQFGAPTGCELTKTFVVVDDPDEPGNKVLRIRQDRDTCITNEGNDLRLQKHRSQFVPHAGSGYFMPKDTEMWMGLRLRFNGSENPPGGQRPYVLQARMFAASSYETPDIRVVDNGRGLAITQAYQDANGVQQYGKQHVIPIVPNQWMNIVMQYRLTSRQPDGYFRLWLNADSVNDAPVIDWTDIWTGSFLDDAILGGASKRDYKTHHSIGWYWGDATTPNDHIMHIDDLRYAAGANGFDAVNPAQ